jgi:hypothetical protein
MKLLKIFTAVLVLSLLTKCSNKNQDTSNENKVLPTEPKIEIATKVKSENVIEFSVETNIPLPIEIMASIDLKNQKPDETYIGASKKMKIEKSPFIFDFDITDYKLPSGEYKTEATFYPKWGANNGNELAKEIKTTITDSSSIKLGTSHGSAEEKKELNKKQSWVMNNVIVDTPWDEKRFKTELGYFEELKVKNRNSEIVKVYYFPEADMTIYNYIIHNPRLLLV